MTAYLHCICCEVPSFARKNFMFCGIFIVVSRVNSSGVSRVNYRLVKYDPDGVQVLLDVQSLEKLEVFLEIIFKRVRFYKIRVEM